jgi:dipeptidyl aminopeptidase/acylaminoacyl peptidase
LFAHGGPTTQAYPRFDPDRAFFTSRGYAWLEVNYRGSTGYGRSYRQALDGRWGVVDVQDVVSGARALAGQGLADGKRMAVYGRSAGGFTAMNALIHHPGTFKAGICTAPVVNLFSMAQDIPKFEKHYADTLVGRLPEAAASYRERSPLYHAGRIQDPVAIFQGSLDDTVSPEQARQLTSALEGSGLPHLYRVYEGEGHSFRSSTVLAAYYREMEAFLQRYVLLGE